MIFCIHCVNIILDALRRVDCPETGFVSDFFFKREHSAQSDLLKGPNFDH
jgi:hypothetical protein